MNSLIGAEMKDLHRLKELYMDGCVFNACRYKLDTPIQFDTDGIPNNFFLCQCSQSLERVSVKNSQYWASGRPMRTDQDPPRLPQTTLMKFIRHAPPSLTWFRSDLSQENIEVLRLERPEIEFV